MKLKVGPTTYLLKYEAELVDDEDKSIWGQCNNRAQVIAIKANLADGQKKITELHEILHALFFLGGLTEPVEEEDLVNTLAPLLLLFMQDNPKYMERLLEKQQR